MDIVPYGSDTNYWLEETCCLLQGWSDNEVVSWGYSDAGRWWREANESQMEFMVSAIGPSVRAILWVCHRLSPYEGCSRGVGGGASCVLRSADCVADAGGHAWRTCSWPTSHKCCNVRQEVPCVLVPDVCTGWSAEIWVSRTTDTPRAQGDPRPPLRRRPPRQVPPRGLQAKGIHKAINYFCIGHALCWSSVPVGKSNPENFLVFPLTLPTGLTLHVS